MPAKKAKFGVFANRADPRYLKTLKERLDIDGPVGLSSTAVSWAHPAQVTKEDRKFSRSVCIDYFGFTASRLFDRGNEVSEGCFQALRDLAARTAELNQDGVAVRIRLLLGYPYSAASQLRMQAEASRKRCAVDDPTWNRGLDFIEHVDDETFKGSRLFRKLKSTLHSFYEWMNELGENHVLRQHPNRIDLRLSTVSPMVCGLRVNDQLFCDSYVLGKEKRFEAQCSNAVLPLVGVNREDAPRAFALFCDHFRYIWECDTTLDAPDAIRVERDGPRVLPPAEVDYAHKANRISLIQPTPPSATDVANYGRAARRILQGHCPPVRPVVQAELAFIACSWSSREDEPSTPANDARRLQRLLEGYLGEQNGKKARVNTRLIFAPPGKDLGAMIFGALRDSTIGIVVLSPEISVQTEDGELWLARPNVYHELGYLMAQLGQERTFMFVERRVQAPSNVGGITHIPYSEDKVALAFTDLIVGLVNCRVLSSSEGLEIGNRHLERLKDMLTEDKITQPDYEWAQNRVNESLRKPAAREAQYVMTPKSGVVQPGVCSFVNERQRERAVLSGEPRFGSMWVT
ncbi:MAG: nucleotide-binding protein, partial [bacterium]|nr:nucleotide-binding protein [bacterium]